MRVLIIPPNDREEGRKEPGRTQSWAKRDMKTEVGSRVYEKRDRMEHKRMNTTKQPTKTNKSARLIITNKNSERQERDLNRETENQPINKQTIKYASTQAALRESERMGDWQTTNQQTITHAHELTSLLLLPPLAKCPSTFRARDTNRERLRGKRNRQTGKQTSNEPKKQTDLPLLPRLARFRLTFRPEFRRSQRQQRGPKEETSELNNSKTRKERKEKEKGHTKPTQQQ